jgi:hypothetical protein
MAESMGQYLYDDESVIPVTDFLIVRVHALIKDVDTFEPVSAVHEVVLGHEEGQSVYGGYVEDVRKCLVVLLVFCRDLSHLLIQV